MLRRSINIRGPPFLLSGRAFSVSSTTLPPVRFGTYLTKYGVNMNKLAEDNKFDPVIGRDDVRSSLYDSQKYDCCDRKLIVLSKYSPDERRIIPV